MLLVNYRWLETILSFTKKRMKKPEPSKASFSSALSLIPTELNLKQDYPNLSGKGKLAVERVLVACQKTVSKPFQNRF
jgi:hypothetical protein